MPWRSVVSPYRTWISEIMLQQTQVDVVRGYFERFVARFPDVHALAAADERDVLSLWAGLGYYSRARNLHRAAKLAVEGFGGLPAEAEAWRALPGIGRYTFGAVRSIAYGEAVPLVDGNVLRVVSRICGLKTRRGEKKSEDAVWALATALHTSDALVRARPGDFNQALMELGATVCGQSAPRCRACPVARACAAQSSGVPVKYPLAKAATKRKRVMLAAVWIEREGKVLLVERERRGLWAGMWALPSIELEERDRDTAPARLRGLLAELGGKHARVGRQIARSERQLTHRHVIIGVHEASARGDLLGRFVSRAELASAGMPAAFVAATRTLC